MMRPAWRTYRDLLTLTREVQGVTRIAQVLKYGSRWKVRATRSDAWGFSLESTVPTKREAKRLGEVELGLTPTPDLLPPAPTLGMIRAAAPRGTIIEDLGDCYELDVAKGWTLDDLHAFVEHYDGGASKAQARRDLFARVTDATWDHCRPDSENCHACGCFPG